MVEGFLAIMSIKTMLLILGSVTVGILLGAIPGITVTMGVALFLPMTYGMDALDGLSVLMGLYMGGTTGGLIAAVLLNIPGNPSCVATTFDGYPMAKRGEAGRALGLGIIGSFIGGIFSIFVLILVAPALADVALQFGPFEYFSIALFSLTMISTLAGKSLIKGMISASLGVVAALVGMAPISAFPRFTFGSPDLLIGFSLLPALVGLFAFSQILESALMPKEEEDASMFAYKLVGLGVPLRDLKKQAGNFLRSSVLGTVIGVLPGVGGAVINIIAYAMEKKYSKYPEKFGTGIDDGIVASETSNNACTGGALVPTLTLGIPGDNTTAVILAGFMIHGIAPGPLLFAEHSLLVYGIFASLLVANVMMLGLSYWTLRACVKLLSVPKNILLPVVGAMCVIGAYGLNNNMFDVWTMLIFGLLGFFLLRLRFGLAPLILGFILAPIIETNLRRGLQRSDGDLTPFFTEPISGAFLLITLLVLIWNIRSIYKQRTRAAA
jgi:putative tricarboxylic transport membrane protein